MKLDVVQDAKDHTYTLTVKIDQFKTLRDYEVLHNLINAISLDFDLDPENLGGRLKKYCCGSKKRRVDRNHL